jgi:lipopolysaccharide transport protein LptA
MTKLTTVALVVITLYASNNEAADDLRPSDDATIIVAADESWEDLGEEIIYFSANVEIRTPRWTLRADRVAVYGNLEDPERIVADGSPVQFTYSKSASDDDTQTRGEGLHLEYLCRLALISLSGNATLTGDRQIMQSSEIRYDLERQRLEAGGPDGVQITVEADSTGHF